MNLVNLQNRSLGKIVQIFVVCFVIVQSSVFTPPTFSNELFPIPKGLESNIKFWIDVYTQYSCNQYVIHDNWYINRIYEVVDWNPDDTIANRSTAWKEANKAKEKYIWILEEFAKGDCGSKHLLSPAHDKVFRLWERSLDPKTYARALDRVRVQRGLQEEFKAGIQRTGRYMKKIREIFASFSLPQELTILPQVESSFRTDAYSYVGAAGMWQFTNYTGQLFMKVGYDVDERLDPYKATEAAAKLLKRNYEMLGTWPLALTAYNHGPLGMKNAKNQLGTDDFETIHNNFKSPSFKFASRNFYLEFLAAKHIFENYRLFIGEVDFERPQNFVEFELPDNVKLSTIIEEYNVDIASIAKLNPSLRTPVLLSTRYIPKGYKLRLPQEKGTEIREKYEHIPKEKKHDTQIRGRYYRVRAGETIGALADRLGCEPSVLLSLNNLFDPYGDYEGLILRIPNSTDSPKPIIDYAETYHLSTNNSDLSEHRSKSKEPPDIAIHEKQTDITLGEEVTVTNSPQKKEYVIERKESDIASQRKFRPADTAAEFHVAQVDLKKPMSGWTTAEPDETLGHYAAWLKVPINELRRVNRLELGSDIRTGQKVRLLFDKVSSDEFHQIRLEYHKGIQEDFFANFRIIDTEVYNVREGDNIWQLCMYEYNVPFWLVDRLNHGKNLMQLEAGAQVIIPVIIEKK